MIAFVCTTIDSDAPALRETLSIWQGAAYVAFDRKTTGGRGLKAEVLSFTDPPRTQFERLCAWDSYARKNIAYLEAARAGANFIFETDDDNALTVPFDELRQYCGRFTEKTSAVVPAEAVNLFPHFYETNSVNIWARGFPVEHIATRISRDLPTRNVPPGVIQFLVDGNPDVDAIYRLVCGAVLDMKATATALPLSLIDAFHPFNSQATLWPRELFSLMYLPTSCPFRMTDIWRSYIAQRVFYELDRCVTFEKPIVNQVRNEHIIHRDFFNELPGYERSGFVIETLRDLTLSGPPEDMLAACYRRLHDVGVFDRKELVLLDAWCEALT